MPSTPARLSQPSQPHSQTHPHSSFNSPYTSSPPTFTSPFSSPKSALQTSSNSTPYPNYTSFSNPNHSNGNFTSNPMTRSHSASHRSAPYMVALSGWPDPVYVSQPLQTRSRPITPRASFSVAEITDGIEIQPRPQSRSGPQSGNVNPSRLDSKQSGPPKESILSKTCIYNPSGLGICPIPGHPRHFDVDTVRLPIPSSSSSAQVSSSFSHTVSMDQDEDERHQKQQLGQEQERERERERERQQEETEEQEEEEEDGPFPTSSTRGTPHPSPPSSSRGFAPPPLSNYPSIASRGAISSVSSSMNMTSSSMTTPNASANVSTSTAYHGKGRWNDIRYGANVAVLANRGALPLTPSWGGSGSSTGSGAGTGYRSQDRKVDMGSSTGHGHVYGQGQGQGQAFTSGTGNGTGMTGRGVKVSAGGRGPGILVMRAVPEVYPPPGGSVATEVYPRDPDAAVLWTRGGGDGMEVDAPGR